MNSIDEKVLRSLTDPLFDALTACSTPGQTPFPLGPDSDLDSYYTERPRCAMAPADFLVASCLDAGEFAQRLAAYWRTTGNEQHAAQAPLVGETAHALHKLYVETQPQTDVSPYIYQMF